MKDFPHDGSRRAGGRSAPLTLAGILFVVGGVAGAVGEWTPASSFAAVMLGLAGFVVYFLCLSAAFFVFAHAGFPYRSAGMSVVLYGLSAVYIAMLVLLAMIGITGDVVWQTLFVVAGLTGSALSIAFTIAAARNPMLPRGLRVLVIVQLVLTIIANTLAAGAGVGVTGVVAIGVGVAYVVLARDAHRALEAAAAATPDDRERLRSRPRDEPRRAPG